MTISKGDIKFVSSQTMDDVPEGGGSPTANVIPDGVSNAIFNDVSEVDRAGGRVNLRKVAVRIDTPDRDTYLGANVIIAVPPNDDNISATLFQTGDFFDTRADAVNRIQAYLSIGTNYAGYLFGNHIKGQQTLQVFQRTSDLPPIGGTLVLTSRETYSDQFQQYVKVAEASSVLRTFEDDKGTYTRYVVTLKLTNALLADFAGFDISRYEYTKAQIALTKLSDTVVADAARYYGVTPLVEAASIGAFTVKGKSMFTQLVPSAQIETPIADSRTNQVSNGVIAGGAGLTLNQTAVFSTTQNLFIGGSIAPNSVSVVGAGVTVTDSGGRLISASQQVGTIDYENGVLALTTNVFGMAGIPLAITYAPGAAPASVNQSQGIEVKVETRSLSYVHTIAPVPVRGTLSLSYMSQGRWYVLREQGDGSIRGSDSAYGAGQLNFTTGTASVTLGALPDVGSQLIYQWIEPEAARDSTDMAIDNGGKFYWPFNTSGAVSLANGAKAITPGALSITWNDGTARTVTDDGAGNLVGYGTGSVSYAQGTIRLSPTTLPAPGTTINVSTTATAVTTSTVSLASGSGSFGATNITPGSISLDVSGQMKAVYMGNPIVNWGAAATYRIVDDGLGKLFMLFNDSRIQVGTVNYAAGTFTLASSTTIASAIARQAVAWDNIFLRQAGAGFMSVKT